MFEDFDDILKIVFFLIIFVGPSIVGAIRARSKKKGEAPARTLEESHINFSIEEMLEGRSPLMVTEKKPNHETPHIQKKSVQTVQTPRPVAKVRPKPKQKASRPTPSVVVSVPKLQKDPNSVKNGRKAAVISKQPTASSYKKKLRSHIIWKEILDPPLALRRRA